MNVGFLITNFPHDFIGMYIISVFAGCFFIHWISTIICDCHSSPAVFWHPYAEQ